MGAITLPYNNGHAPFGAKASLLHGVSVRLNVSCALALFVLFLGGLYITCHHKETGTFVWAGEIHYDAENRPCQLDSVEGCLDEGGNELLPHRLTGTASSLETCLKTEFKKYGATLQDVQLSADLVNARQSHENGEHPKYPSLVMIAAGNEGYKYSPTWIQNRVRDGASHALFSTSATIRNGELTSHYSRIPSLLASMACMPNVPAFVYTDTDTLIDFHKVEAFASNSSCAVAMSWKPKGHRGAKVKELRTNWFVVKNNRPSSYNFLLSWYYNGRLAKYQDQTILNELYDQKNWVRDMMYIIRTGTPLWTNIELKHCFSGLKETQRTECIKSLALSNYVKNV